MNSKPSVAVIHPQPLVAESIATALARHRGPITFECASSATEGLRVGARADVAVVDAGLLGAAVCARRLRALGARVVVLEDGPTDDSSSNVSKRAPVRDLASAVFPGPVPDDAMGTLTKRERQVLSLVTDGLAGKQIARVLGISAKTVERHKTRIYSKLGVPNQAAAAGLAVRHLENGDSGWNQSSM